MRVRFGGAGMVAWASWVCACGRVCGVCVELRVYVGEGGWSEVMWVSGRLTSAPQLINTETRPHINTVINP